MFANPLWSVLILLALVGVYIIIRIKHGKPLFAAYTGDGWLGNWLAWLVAFRSWVVNSIGGVLIAAPDLVVALTGIDLTPLIGQTWASRIVSAMLIFNAVNAAFKTRPDGVKAA